MYICIYIYTFKKHTLIFDIPLEVSKIAAAIAMKKVIFLDFGQELHKILFDELQSWKLFFY